ncbi:hypothetical protein HTZ77_10130 [Nonomuraea sp. SMC257]|uniref:WD40 repeat domain-containing protein n=1 Tax=Nonomuraea montanisoli TaxID=2741721 RepID=A0A7Y6I4W7_9ACTN|nr:hypothetical protein [Nonomuraea montanisoli]NUW31783.1 hypothetical protein [Nonomuraea montanisoli]
MKDHFMRSGSRRLAAVCAAVLLMGGCADPARETASGTFDGPWTIGVQPGDIHEAYVAKADLRPVPLPDCAVDSDREDPVLSRDGRAIALTGCWRASDSTYETVVIRERTLQEIPSITGAAEWVGTTGRLLGEADDGVLRLVDTARSADPGRVLTTLDGKIHAIDVNPAGTVALVLYGGREAGQDGKVTLADTRITAVSLTSGHRDTIHTPAGTVDAQWTPDGRHIVAETANQWITFDSRSATTTDARPRPSTTMTSEAKSKATMPCRLVAVTNRSTIGWCPATGEIMRFDRHSDSPAATRLAHVDQQRPLDGSVSVAVDLLLD